MRRAGVIVVALLTFAVACPRDACGAFASAVVNTGSSVTSATLQPPTNLSVSFRCVLLGILRPVADLTWTASPSTATGYELDRYKGAVLQQTFTIPGTATTSYTDGLGGVFLALSTTYTWRLRTYRGTWVSSDAVTFGTTPLICT